MNIIYYDPHTDEYLLDNGQWITSDEYHKGETFDDVKNEELLCQD